MENSSDREEEGETEAKSRIYLGGLGVFVTEDEIRKTFSGLGKVESVDIFRTKGRSFAYLDFVPSNTKSLPKLFSTYNGCLWKGGKLRLEKAKDHYLVRMKREWSEDAQLAKNVPIHDVDAPESMPSEKLKKLLTLDKPNLRIFFPKLNKMKSVPFGGSGKHKYSFQRITVPNLPIHFCDCEDHYDSSHMAKETPSSDLDRANGGIGEKELNIMESVMNKLFMTETHPKGVHCEAISTEERDRSVDPIDLPIDENVSDPLSDEDDLIINTVAGGNETIPLLRSRGGKAITVNQEPAYGGSKTSKDWPARKLHKNQSKKIEPCNKKRKSPLAEVSDGNELGSFNTERKRTLEITSNEREDQITESRTQHSAGNFAWSQKSAWKDLVGKRGDNTPFQISHIVPSVPSAKEELPKSDDLSVPYFTNVENLNLPKPGNPQSEIAQSKDLLGAESKDLQGGAESKDLHGDESPALPNDVSIKSARGASWRQKSSWTQLVGDTNKISFSISQVVPGLTFEKQELLQPNGTDGANTRDNIEQKGDGLKLTNKYLDAALSTSDAIALPKSPPGPEIEHTTTEDKQQTVGQNNEVASSALGNRQPSRPKQISDHDFGETCSFMRNADSMKEWAKAKAALSKRLSQERKSDGK